MSEQTVFNGRYELHRRLARGGMADVFLARDQLLDRPVAVKVLFPEYANDPSFVERFRREAQNAANLNHPNIVAVYDWGQERGTYFIVMEYIEGRTLADILRSEGPLHPQRAAEIASDVAAALGFAHRNGVIHRDIKPANVMVSPSGQVKVADFGIARALSSPTDQHLTQAGSVMGTASYFSPEQAQGHQLDPRSDLYSLGVVLYEMTTGRLPFAGESPVAIAYKHVQEMPQPPKQLNPSLPDDIQAITLKLLSKQPADRYPSADDLRADLRRFRDGIPTMALAGAGAAAAAVAGATRAVPQQTVAATYGVPPGGAYAEDEWQEEPERRSPWLIAGIVLLVLLLAGAAFAAFRAMSGDDNNNAAPPTDSASVIVPDVSGQTVAQATATLVDKGLKVASQQSQADPTVAVGLVVTTNPPPTNAVPAGTGVILIVSTGPGTITMPGVVGQTFDQAKSQLLNQGFVDANIIRKDQQTNDTKTVNQVITQDPAANAAGIDAKTQQVTLTVNAGQATQAVPDVSLLSESDARTRLNKDGFAVAQQSKSENSATVPAGKVIRTDPTAGSSIPTTQTVTLVVSSGPAGVAVPDVTGLKEANATTKLTGAGFKVTVDHTTADTATDADIGTVVTQDPSGGGKAQAGATVTITILDAPGGD